MANMYHCRFENTYGDLSECFGAIANGENLSSSEMRYAERMRVLCERYIAAFDNYCEEEEDMRSELVKYVANRLVGKGDEIRLCLRTMNECRCGLSDAIEGCISDAISDYILDNDLIGTDEEERLRELSFEDLFFDALDLMEE